MLGVLGLLPVTGLAASALPTGISALLIAGAAGLEWRAFVQPQPIRLRWQENGSLWLDWADGSEQCVELIATRQVAQVTVLRLAVDQSTRWLTLWPDSLNASDRKALRRRLQAGLPSANSG